MDRNAEIKLGRLAYPSLTANYMGGMVWLEKGIPDRGIRMPDLRWAEPTLRD